LAVPAVLLGRPAVSAAAPGGGATPAPAPASPGKTPEEALAAEISAALAATTFPELDPAIDLLGTDAWVRDVVPSGCADIDAGTADSCVVPGTGAGTVAVLGDSYAIAWMPAIRSAVGPAGYAVHPYTRGQCPSAMVTVTRDQGAGFPLCDSHRGWALESIVALAPDIVVLADADNTLERLASRATGAAAADEVRDGYAATLATLHASGSRIVLLAPPPRSPSLQSCVTRVATPDQCAGAVSDRWTAYSGAMADAADDAGVQFVDSRSWFCAADGACPGFIGTTPVRADGSHLTVRFAELLGPVLGDALLGDAP
ncbi:MAG: putative acetyltransferase, partial [Naasia sp.]|nr:putative acetyltransferase [Naasia sp.]